ncbi:MAG: hypothetical protein HY294_07890 [Candidatus Rokubacteria bacterium]|nr:hypothetical protein [Candidatus Rokubacteria bacterium]
MISTVRVASARATDRPGVPPEDPWTCPASHPIKGYASYEPGRRVYYVPASRFYEEASPERCYACEDEARRDGCRPSRDDTPVRLHDVVRADGFPRDVASHDTTGSRR